MDFDLSRTIQLITIYAIPVILAITLHEAAHAFAAKRWGDSTAFMLGRMTANPIKHIDPVGTILVPAVLLLLSKGMSGVPIFGWAKPVPVNMQNLRSPRRDMGYVAAAGPLSNFVMAIGWAIFALIVQSLELDTFFSNMAFAGVVVNIALAVLNLLPFPPLDGGRIVVALLPAKLAYPFARLEPYGMMILIGLMVSGILGRVMGPLVDVGVELIVSIFGIAS
jgi:Zn-dependent protease